MSIRMIAQELYRLIQEVERLENKSKSVPFDKHAKIKDQQSKKKAERNRMHAIKKKKKEHK